MSKNLKINVVDRIDTENFEKLSVLIKKFSLETYLGNKPEFADLKGIDRYQLLDKAINELDSIEENDVLSIEDIDKIKEEFEQQMRIAKKFINDDREDVSTRYYVLKYGENIVAFQQGQVSKEKEGTVGWRNLIYAEPEYRGKKGQIIDTQGNLTENFYFDALWEELGKWFNENNVDYERICTGVNMIHNIKKYIDKNFLPFQKNESNIFLKKYAGQNLDKNTLMKVYELYCINKQRDSIKDVNAIMQEIEETDEFANLTIEQKNGLVQSFLKEDEKQMKGEKVMGKEKCYHMTSHLREIMDDENPEIKPLVGENSKHVNDTRQENIGISYSLGLEGVVVTNAMFRARYQYDLLENKTDRDVTLDDMFEQDVHEREDKALGSNIYLTFDETEEIKKENEERDIADPKTKSPIDMKNVRGVVLKNKNTGEIKYDRESIIRYAVSKTNIKDILAKLKGTDKPFMNIPGYGKTDFSFKEYVQRYYEEMIKDPKMLEFKNDEYELEEIDVKEFLKILETDKTKDKNAITMQSLVRNALGKENTRTDEVEKADKEEARIIEQEKAKEGVERDDR